MRIEGILEPLGLCIAEKAFPGGLSGYVESDGHQGDGPNASHVETLASWLQASTKVVEFVLDGPMSWSQLHTEIRRNSCYPESKLPSFPPPGY